MNGAVKLPIPSVSTLMATINVSNLERFFVAAAIVHWVRGQEYDLETLRWS